MSSGLPTAILWNYPMPAREHSCSTPLKSYAGILARLVVNGLAKFPSSAVGPLSKESAKIIIQQTALGIELLAGGGELSPAAAKSFVNKFRS